MGYSGMPGALAVKPKPGVEYFESYIETYYHSPQKAGMVEAVKAALAAR